MLGISKIKSFYSRFESHIGVLALLFGFVFDNLTLRNATINTQTTIFLIYLALSVFAILMLNTLDEREARGLEYKRLHFGSFILLQFTLGSLFSMFFVFYSRGVSISSSWPFLLLLFGNMIGSELFKQRYSKVSVQISLLFISIFSFSIYFLPVVLHSIGDFVFILSGFVSLILVFLFTRALARIARIRVAEDSRNIVVGVVAIYFLINIFYFLNIIPPVPLAMRDGGVYHSLVLIDGSYIVGGEEDSFWSFFSPYPVYHYSSGDAVYVVAAVYAPADLNTTIAHNWQYFDDKSARWQSSTIIPVAIVGGREAGYRSYSVKRNIAPGLWRVNIETVDGRVIGRVKFKIVEDGASYILKQEEI